MRVIRHVVHAGPAGRPRVVAAGSFDGVHRGHQRVLAHVVDRARTLGGEAAVIVAGGSGVPRLTDRRQQLELLRAAAIDVVAFAPRGSVEEAAVRLGVAVRVTGRGEGTASPGDLLEEIAPVAVDGEPVTVSAICAVLSCGDLDAARAMLGRDPGVGGRVVHGFHRGGPLGIPTANLRVRGIQLPPDGVYAVRARVADARLTGVANIGFNPTFGNQIRTVETHLLDFSGDLYGRRLEIAFRTRLRGERKFPDVPALLAQVRSDIAAARRFFERDGG